MWWIILIVVVAILIPYFISCTIAFNKIFKRGKEIPLVSLDLSKTQYKDYEKELREYTAFFDNISPEIVNIKSNDGLNLKGYYYKNKLDTLIICFHGYRAIPLNNFPVMGKKLYEKGYSLLMIVERSHSISDGKYITFGDMEKYDCINWINYANEVIKPDKIYLYGLSMGAATILLASALGFSDNVKGLIADSSFDESYHAVVSGLRRTVGFTPHITLIFIRLLMKIHKINVKRNKVYEAVAKNKIKTLFIHGKNDNLVPIAEGRKNYDAAICKKEWIETEAQHVLSIYTDMDLISNKIINFIEEE